MSVTQLQWMTPAQLAERLCLSHRTLARWRMMQTGPRYHQFGHRCVRYRVADVDAWLAAREAASNEG